MKIRNTLVTCVALAGLLSCANQPAYYPTEALPPPDLLSGSASPGLAKLRVVIQFKEPVAFDDLAFVQAMQDHCHALLHYLAAVSADTHVYSMELPLDQDPALTLRRLATFTSIGRVEIDHTNKAP